MTQPMFRHILSLGLVLLVTGFTRAEPTAEVPEATQALAADSAQDPMSDALVLFQNNDKAGALRLLKQAVASNSALPPAEIIMASWCGETNQPGLAMTYLEQAIRVAETDPEAYIHLANISLQDGRWTEAGMLYEKAWNLLEAFDGDATRKSALELHLLAGLASLAEKTGKLDEAELHLAQLLESEPNHPGALLQYGKVLFLQKKTDEAFEAFRRASAQQEAILAPEVAIAMLFQQYGDRMQASEWMTKALNARPRDLRTRLIAAEWSLETNQVDQAGQQADAALVIDPESLQAKFIRATVALFQKDYDKAEQLFEEIHLTTPGNFGVTNNLALVLCEQDDPTKKQQALQYAEMNVQLTSQRSEAFSTLGWVLYRMDRLAEAEAALRRSASGGNISPDTAYYIAQVDAARGRVEEAKQLLTAVLQTTGPFSRRADAQALFDSLK